MPRAYCNPGFTFCEDEQRRQWWKVSKTNSTHPLIFIDDPVQVLHRNGGESPRGSITALAWHLHTSNGSSIPFSVCLRCPLLWETRILYPVYDDFEAVEQLTK